MTYPSYLHILGPFNPPDPQTTCFYHKSQYRDGSWPMGPDHPKSDYISGDLRMGMEVVSGNLPYIHLGYNLVLFINGDTPSHHPFQIGVFP